MLCWGSWGNTQKLAGKSWRFELFYWDYVLGILSVFTACLDLHWEAPEKMAADLCRTLAQAEPGNMLNAIPWRCNIQCFKHPAGSCNGNCRNGSGFSGWCWNCSCPGSNYQLCFCSSGQCRSFFLAVLHLLLQQ